MATSIDGLLANFMQGRSNDIGQIHYYLPMLEKNKKKYPVNLVKGKSKKYTEY